MFKFVISLALIFIGKMSDAASCGYNVTGSSGSIQSPNYPDFYGGSMNCYYYLTTPPGSIPFLDIVDLDTYSPSDTVYVYDGTTTSNRTLISLNGHDRKNIFLSNATTNEILVRFSTSGYYDGYRGFNITFHENACRDEMTGSSGTFLSRNYPRRYYNNMDCDATITTSEDTIIALQINDLEMESCCDYIKFFDGPSNDSKCLGIYTGEQSKINILTTTNQLYFQYHTDNSVTQAGFSLSFTENEKCEQEISGSYGTVISPGYPVEPYLNNQDCYYKITTFGDAGIHFEIIDMDLQPDADYIEIYGGHTSNSQLIGRYTGNQSRVDLFVGTKEAMVYFHTDDSVQNTGFYINFEETEEHICDASGNYSGNSGSILSPVSENGYPSQSDCYYYIKTSENTQITFHVNSLDLELSDDCTKDFFQIYDGATESSNSLAKFCGSGPFPDIVSSSNEVLAYFHSDSETEGAGFRISYDTNPCFDPIAYIGDFGTIYSPGYPHSNYPNFANCKYSVETPFGSKVQLTVSYIDIESESNCAKDYVRIYDGSDENDSVLAQLCGDTLTETNFQASNHKILIEFHSDESINNHGFSIIYSAVYD